MTNRMQRMASALLLAGFISGGLVAPALAGNRGAKRSTPQRQEQRRGGNGDHGRSGERGRYQRPEHREWRGNRGHSGILPFLGGVVLGAVISNHCDVPPPRVHSVVFVYDCDWCAYRTRGYADFCDHMVYEHRIPRCDVGRWFHPNEHGSWEDD